MSDLNPDICRQIEEMCERVDAHIKRIESVSDLHARAATKLQGELEVANRRVEILQRWKDEQMSVESWWIKIDKAVRDRFLACVGESVAAVALNKIEQAPDEAQRQQILLALAKLSFSRPGWKHSLRETAVQLGGGEMFDMFAATGPDASMEACSNALFLRSFLADNAKDSIAHHTAISLCRNLGCPIL